MRGLVRFTGRWTRRAVVVILGLVAGWICAGYAEGHLPGTTAHSTIIQSGPTWPSATQPAARPTRPAHARSQPTPATQPGRR